MSERGREDSIYVPPRSKEQRGRAFFEWRRAVKEYPLEKERGSNRFDWLLIAGVGGVVLAVIAHNVMQKV